MKSLILTKGTLVIDVCTPTLVSREVVLSLRPHLQDFPENFTIFPCSWNTSSVSTCVRYARFFSLLFLSGVSERMLGSMFSVSTAFTCGLRDRCLRLEAARVARPHLHKTLEDVGAILSFRRPGSYPEYTGEDSIQCHRQLLGILSTSVSTSPARSDILSLYLRAQYKWLGSLKSSADDPLVQCYKQFVMPFEYIEFHEHNNTLRVFKLARILPD